MAAELFRLLSQAGIIVEAESEEKLDIYLRAYPACSDIFRYLSFRGAVNFSDYSSTLALDTDAQLMVEYERDVCAPEIFKHYADATLVSLPHPATHTPHNPPGRLGWLLYWPFGRLRDACLHHLPAMLKSVPSMGARHPFEAYIVSRGYDSLTSGVYHYDVERHALAFISHELKNIPPGITLIVTVVFERFQWRYRHSWNYKDLYYDLGHVNATIKLIAEELGIRLTEVAWTYAVPGSQPLFEECVMAYHIDEM